MNNNTFIIQHEELGEIFVKRDRRAKRISIRPNSFGCKMTVPFYTSKKYIRQVIEENKERINTTKARTKFAHYIDDMSPLVTHCFEIKVRKSLRNNFDAIFSDHTLTILYPSSLDVKSPKTQSLIWKIIENFLVVEAKKIFPNLTQNLAKKYNFQYNLVKISRSKTRWGSCSSKRNINLSCYLMLLPVELQKYVVLHELCHTVEMNHSQRFWGLMDKVTENQSKRLRLEMKKYSIPF